MKFASLDVAIRQCLGAAQTQYRPGWLAASLARRGKPADPVPPTAEPALAPGAGGRRAARPLGIENRLHWIRDVVSAEDLSQVRTAEPLRPLRPATPEIGEITVSASAVEPRGFV